MDSLENMTIERNKWEEKASASILYSHLWIRFDILLSVSNFIRQCSTDVSSVSTCLGLLVNQWTPGGCFLQRSRIVFK
jgi:hypothetical protein